jgi:hypothetical protein
MVADIPINCEIRRNGTVTIGRNLRGKFSENMANLFPDKNQEATIKNGQDSRYD